MRWSDTIARMAKFKPVKPKRRDAPATKSGLPCLILVIAAFVLVMLFIVLWLKNASG